MRPTGSIPRAAWLLRGRVGRDHAPRHAHGPAAHVLPTCPTSTATSRGGSSAPAWPSRSPRASGASSRPRTSRTPPQDPAGRHRDDQHRLPPQLGRHRRLLRLSPGLYSEGAQWLVDKGVKLVGRRAGERQPHGTKMVDHGPGPPSPPDRGVKAETGRDLKDDFPDWEAGHKLMVKGGIPGIENIGGDLDEVTGKRCTFMAFPWRCPRATGAWSGCSR